MSWLPRRVGAPVLGAAVVLALGFTELAQDGGSNSCAKVVDILTRMDRGGLATVWDRAVELENLGGEAAPLLAKKLQGATGLVKLGLAKALLAATPSLGGGWAYLITASTERAARFHLYQWPFGRPAR